MKTDLLNRRLRFAPPNPVVRRLLLTEADLQIFEAINRHGPLPTHYLYEFTKHLRKDYTHLQNRLTEFYNGDDRGPFLIRPPSQFSGFEARYQHIVYDLSPRARAALSERGTLSAYTPKRNDPFLHQLMQACAGATFERQCAEKGLRYISRDEILSHPKCSPEAKSSSNPRAIPLTQLGDHKSIVPDDLFGIEYPKAGFRFFAVEIDRNTESIERKNLDQNAFGRKIAGYLDILSRKTHLDWWGIPNLTVLTLTTNATHAMNIMEYVRKHAEPAYQDRFAFAVDTSFGSNWRVPKTLLLQLLNEPWTTASGAKDISVP